MQALRDPPKDPGVLYPVSPDARYPLEMSKMCMWLRDMRVDYENI